MSGGERRGLPKVVDDAAVVAGGPPLVGATPPMGFSTWNVFGGDIDEEKVLGVMDVMEKLRPFGYEYVNIDDGWQADQRAPNGSLLANPVKFPHGIQFLCSEAHRRNLKFGIYSARGNRTCQNHPGSAGYYETDARTWALWGVDYIKLDSCGGSGSWKSLGVYEDYRMMSDAIKVFSPIQPMYFSICP